MKPANRLKSALAYLLGAAAVIAVDQGYKKYIVDTMALGESRTWIPGVLDITFIRNTGAAFGMMKGGRWAFLVLLAAFCVLVVWAIRTNRIADGFSRWMAVLALGGALSNGIDRAVAGSVVDMFEPTFIQFAIFNVADAVMNVCAVLFILRMLFSKEPSPAEAPEESAPAAASEAVTGESGTDGVGEP